MFVFVFICICFTCIYVELSNKSYDLRNKELKLRHTTSHDLKVLYTEQIFIDILNILYKQNNPVVYFLPVTIVQKQEKLSIYF